MANITANITLAFGAAPVMADESEEVEDMVAQAQALVLNTGTPSRAGWEAVLRAGRAANRCGIPVALDPMGVGATRFRKDLVHELVTELKFAVIRGNLAEMGMLAGEAVRPRASLSVPDFSAPSSLTRWPNTFWGLPGQPSCSSSPLRSRAPSALPSAWPLFLPCRLTYANPAEGVGA